MKDVTAKLAPLVLVVLLVGKVTASWKDSVRGAMIHCPAPGSGRTAILPHQFDCSLFFQCQPDDLRPSLILRCPDGLHFNQYTRDGCVEKEIGGCNPILKVTQSVADVLMDMAPPVCPIHEAANFTFFLPHQVNCQQFYKCYRNTATLTQCPEGLHFNRLLEVCDFPEDAACEFCDEILAPHCPSTNTGFARHLPNPDDCGSFYKCDWGTPVLFQCPAGLHFNIKLQVCDYPFNAGCDKRCPRTESQVEGQI